MISNLFFNPYFLGLYFLKFENNVSCMGFLIPWAFIVYLYNSAVDRI